MRIHIIACQVFNREFAHYIAKSDNIIDVCWLEQGLHDTPVILKEKLQNAILEAEKRKKNIPDAIVLGYGLCSNGVAGLSSSKFPLVVPRTDDCIAVFLGSQKRYLEYFYKNNSTYWLSLGWIEHGFVPNEKTMLERKQDYIREFGEEGAEYLYQFDVEWTKKYSYLTYIQNEFYQNEIYLKEAREIARHYDWNLDIAEADDSLIEDLIEGRWDEERFLVCPPNHTIELSYDETKITAAFNQDLTNTDISI